MGVREKFVWRVWRWFEWLLLIAVCVALGRLVSIEAERLSIEPVASAPASPPLVASIGARDGQSFAMPPLRDFTEVLKRPLFSERRRPAVAAAAAEATLPGVTLVGVVLASGEHRALIEHGKPPRLDHFTEGQEMDEWTVEAIRIDRVVLSHGDSRVEVKLKDQARPAMPPRRTSPVVGAPPQVMPPAVPPDATPGG
jgi:hypothetical protein